MWKKNLYESCESFFFLDMMFNIFFNIILHYIY